MGLPRALIATGELRVKSDAADARLADRRLGAATRSRRSDRPSLLALGIARPPPECRFFSVPIHRLLTAKPWAWRQLPLRRLLRGRQAMGGSPPATLGHRAQAPKAACVWTVAAGSSRGQTGRRSAAAAVGVLL